MNERGHYGSNGVPRIGQVAPAPAAVYVEREPSSVVRILGALAVVGSVLWTRHQSRQIEQLYKKAGLPYQSFPASLRQGAGASLRGIAERVRPKRKGES